MSVIEQRLQELGITLPQAPVPMAVYIPAVTTGNLVYTSGTVGKIDGKLVYEGKLGRELTIAQGQESARLTMLNQLAILKQHLGDLDRIEKVVKLLGFVNSAPGFVEHPYVINGASELLEQVFGERGKHARSAIGTSELPFNAPVEIEMIVEIKA